MPERSLDWLRQARRDLESAVWEAKGGFYDWACFAAQQAAEKALKALYQRLGGEVRGHSVFKLLQGLEDKIFIPPELKEIARKLDRYYIPTRYPNGWPEGIPAEYYTEEDSREAITGARKILRFCEDFLARKR